MTFGAVFPGVMRAPFGGGAVAADWWAVTGQTCVAAYQPKGAASLAASYFNLANPGTYNAAPGVAPTWAGATGWTFNGTTQWLTTGYVPINSQARTLIARFSGVTVTRWSRIAVGTYDGSGKFFLLYVTTSNATPFAARAYGNGATIAPDVGVADGVMCVAGNKGYYNGAGETGTIASGGEITKAVYIGARNNTDGVPKDFMGGNIQAIAIYSTTLSAVDVAALTTRMNAL